MNDSGRNIPPSSGRVSAAARQGRFPRSGLLNGGVLLLVFAGLLRLWGESLGLSLLEILKNGIWGAVDLRLEPREALEQGVFDGIVAVAPFLAVLFVMVLLWGVIVRLSAGRGGGRTVVPIPKERKLQLSTGVITFISLLLSGIISFKIFKNYGSHLTGLFTGDLLKGGEVLGLFVSIIAATGAILTLGGLADLALSRVRLFRELSLNSSEALREERAIEGDGMVKSRLRSFWKKSKTS